MSRNIFSKKGFNRSRRGGNAIRTRSGKQLKIKASLPQKFFGMNEAKARRKAERLRGMPKSRIRRVIWRLNPRRLAAFWFSRDGAIMAVKIVGISILLFFILTMAVFAYFRKDLPNIKDISGSNLGGSISYYDKTGKVLLWQDYDAVKRVPIQGTEMSNYLKLATVSVEDRDYYNHRGFDLKGIIRAAFNDIFKRGGTQGGSTITQQLVKIDRGWSDKRTISNKIKEIILAVELERSYTKDEILTGYLNAVPYGSVDYGVQAAASDYFHKSAKDLTLAEAAMLAAIPKSPSVYSPYNKSYFDPELFTQRYKYVLDSMAQTGRITKAEADAAKQVDVLSEVQPQQTKYSGIKYPYFVLAAKNELTSRFAPSNSSTKSNIGGWKVITSLDIPLQEEAEKQVSSGIKQVQRQGGDEIAFAAEDVQTGQMVALVGGVDFNNVDHGQINYAQWPISPGSSFKPYDYATLINNSNAGAGSVIYDQTGPLPGYPCTNKALPKQGGNCLMDYDFRSPGPLTLRYSLGGSRNIPAVKAILMNGVDKTISTAEAMGLTSGYKCYSDDALTKTTQCYGAAGIGDGAFLHLDEHVNAMATMSRFGTYLKQTYILQIDNSTGKTLYKWEQPSKAPDKVQVLKPEAAYIVTDMMSDPNASYLSGGRPKPQRSNGWHVAIKTGTTNDGKDGLMMGFTTKYAVGVWVGYHNRQKALNGFMESMTQPVLQGWNDAVYKNQKPVNWTEPSGIQHLPAFVVTTHVGVGSVEPSPSTELFPSWFKMPNGSANSSSDMDKVSNKLATTCTPTLAKQTSTGNSNANKFSVDTFFGATSSTSSTNDSQDNVHSCSDVKPSFLYYTINGVDATDSSNQPISCAIDGCTVTVTVQSGTHPLNDSNYPQNPGTVNLIVNGQVAASKTAADGTPITFDSFSVSGSATVAVQVIDSVLYDTTTSSVSVSGP